MAVEQFPGFHVPDQDVAAVCPRQQLAVAAERQGADRAGVAPLHVVDGTVDETTVQPTVEQVLGRPPRSFAQWAEAHSDAFR